MNVKLLSRNLMKCKFYMNRKLIILCAFLFGLLACNDHVVGQPLAQKIEKAIDEANISGSVIVARAGSTLVSTGRGMANIELHVPNTPRTKFRIGSITKQFTAMAILILHERRLVDVEDAVGKGKLHIRA